MRIFEVFRRKQRAKGNFRVIKAGNSDIELRKYATVAKSRFFVHILTRFVCKMDNPGDCKDATLRTVLEISHKSL